MYNLDNEQDEPEPRLYTHDLYNSADEPYTEEIPVQSPETTAVLPVPVYVAPLANPALITFPHEPLGTTHEVVTPEQQSTVLREGMWMCMIAGGLLPLLGLMGGGFQGFIIGTIIGMGFGILGAVIRFKRLVAIDRGRTDLEFSKTEENVELVLGAALAGMAVVKGIHMMENHHAQNVADRINRMNGSGS